MAQTGIPKGAGRVQRAVATAVRRSKTSKRRSAAARPGEPLGYILAVMCDENADEKRRDAMAKEALPYCHAKLSGSAQRLKPLSDMTEAELAALEGEAKEKS